MPIRIYGEAAQVVMRNGRRCKLLDVDKGREEVYLMYSNGVKEWVSYKGVSFMGKPLTNSHIKLPEPSGSEKQKRRAARLAAQMVSPQF